MSTRDGDWQQTFLGKQFYPLDPRPDEVHLEDIAHALSLQCRFGGHCRVHYSVAEHSVRVSYVCAPEDALWGLLHDAAEAYCVDVPRPLKRSLPEYHAIEARVMRAICERFGLPFEMPPSVGAADEILLATEKRDLMSPSPVPWSLVHDPLPERIVPWSLGEAEWRFLGRFRELAAL